MATTYQVAATLQATSGTETLQLQKGLTSITPVGSNIFGGVQTIGTSYEVIVAGDIGTAWYFAMQNTDSTNYVEVALANDGSGVFAKLFPGDVMLIPLETKTIYAKAHTSSCVINYVMTEL